MGSIKLNNFHVEDAGTAIKIRGDVDLETNGVFIKNVQIGLDAGDSEQILTDLGFQKDAPASEVASLLQTAAAKNLDADAIEVSIKESKLDKWLSTSSNIITVSNFIKDAATSPLATKIIAALMI